MRKASKVLTVILLFCCTVSFFHGLSSISNEDEVCIKGSEFRPVTMDIADASLASFWGEVRHDYSGSCVSGAGDVNGDGYDDILIASSKNYDGGGFLSGQTYLVLGKVEGWSMDTDLGSVEASFWGESSSDWSGCSVSGAGDVNGDGYDDILIGAFGANKAYLIMGKAAGWSMDTSLSYADVSFGGTYPACYEVGWSVSGAGDVNGDGYDDLLIGDPYEMSGLQAGRTHLIFGRATGWSKDIDLSNADASFVGERTEDHSGWSVTGAGDVNGDGYDDILIGAIGDDDGGISAGQTYLILGKPTGWSMDTDLSLADASFWGENADDYSGRSVSGAGDVNGDGYDDILIGSSQNDDGGNGAGQAYLIFGKATGWSMDTDLSLADASFWGEDIDDNASFSVSGAGDVNNDGYDDIIIGASGDDDGGSNAGSTYLILGKATGWSMDMDLSKADAFFIGEDPGFIAGRSVSGVGDVNGDGNDDILIGAPEAGYDMNYPGQAYLIAGPCNMFFKKDLTQKNATTGDEIIFSIKMVENITIPSVYIEYWYGESSHNKISMTNIEDSIWNCPIIAPLSGLDRLYYFFSMPFKSKYWINSTTYNITILDNDPPEFGLEHTAHSAFTGNKFIFSIGISDNIGVNKVLIEYWFENGDHVKIPANSSSGYFWEGVIIVPYDSLNELYYKYFAEDYSGNWNETLIKSIPVYDDDKPEFKGFKPINPTTGDEIIISMFAIDNIEVSEVFFEYWYDDEPANNISLSQNDANEWRAVIRILDRICTFHYCYKAVDSSGNWNQTMKVDVKIDDNDPPVFGDDTSDTSATTGGSFTFRVGISDIVGLSRTYARYWCGEEEPIRISLTGIGQFTSTIIVPINWTELSYSFHAVDDAENYQETEPRTIEVLDNYAPMILEHISEDTCGTGCVLPLSVIASDNIAVSNVSVEYWYGDGDHHDLVLEGEGYQFSGSLEVPVGSVEMLYYIIKVTDASGNQNETSVYEVEIIDSIAPTLGSVDDVEVYVGDEIDLILNADDNIGIVSYLWTGSPIDVSGNRLSGILEEVGEYIIHVIVKDGEGNSNTTTFTLTVLPIDHDDDGDGIPDLVEIEFGLDPNDGSDAVGDLDADGLSNLREYELGTKMNDDDSDGDGFSDGYEVENGFDPLDPLSGKDIEGPEEEGSNSWIWVVVVIVVVLLIVAAIVVFLFMGKKKEEPDEIVSEEQATETDQKEGDTPQLSPPPEVKPELPPPSSQTPQKPELPAAPATTGTIEEHPKPPTT